MKRFYILFLSVLCICSCADKFSGTSDTLGTGNGVLSVGILGDSISTYEGYIDSSYKSYYPRIQDGVRADVDDWTKTYWGILLQEYWHAELDVNASWSGTCITPRSDFKTDFLTRAGTFGNPDIIIVNGGTNDYLKRPQKGGTVTPEDYRTAYRNLLSFLKGKYPRALIIIVIGDFVKLDYGDISKETADEFGLPCVDFRQDSKNRGKVFDEKTNPHPNASGMRFMAEKIYNQTKSTVESLNK